MDVQLTRDGTHRPFLGVIEAQDLCLDVRRRHRVRVSGRVALQPVSAMTAAAQKPLADELRAPATTPVTVCDHSPGPILRAAASLALTGEPGASRSSGDGGGEP
jgi:hypothetical protein